MPLFILGLLLLICILAYAIFRYVNSADYTDDRPVRERYPHAFPVHRTENDTDEDREEPPVDAESYYDEDSFRGDIDHIIRNLKRDLKERTKDINLDLDSIRRKFGDHDEDDGDNTVEFPKDNIENEKKKRGIHTDK